MKWMDVKEKLPVDLIDSSRFVFVTSDIWGFMNGNAIYLSEKYKPVAGFYRIIDGEWKLDEDVRYWIMIPNPLCVFYDVAIEPCPNCKETVKECACMRNICLKCGNPVGNTMFTICDECWGIEFPPKK